MKVLSTWVPAAFVRPVRLDHIPGESFSVTNGFLWDHANSRQRLYQTPTTKPYMQAVSVPISIPVKLQRPSSPDQSPSQKEFIPPHKLSQRSQSQLAQSVPLTSSAQLRTRDMLMTATGLLPRHGPDGLLLQQQPAKQACPAGDESVLTPIHVSHRNERRRCDKNGATSPTGDANCAALSCPTREMRPFLRRTAPMERPPQRSRQLALSISDRPQ